MEDCRWGKNLKSKDALKSYLRRLNNLKIPMDIFGAKVFGRRFLVCIFPDCQFPNHTVEEYQTHLINDHSPVLGQTLDNINDNTEAE
ncbi:hypothetical protein K450DRAFT_259721 [Umbelopsis ramanniana AG]|uniref:Uncharacterized protein n=1 Tax=Umbelopsis ramanniana AG TaxID=1314678 RepID=A0AAD5H8S1_UMBRA|nr:uncharacterized protein K450DRAFT_259721 [Umbelopsis ramanniana AG]KAI8575895.1 hypothetical protein K450DRAFT_259721 [Umbelopsis ramanniana AG]